MLLHAGLERAEIVDLGSKHQVGQLSIRQEDDEEHDGKTHKVLGTARHGAGELTHGLIEVDELKKLRGREFINRQHPLRQFGSDYEPKGKYLYLDPGKKDDDCSHVVKLDLQGGQRLKAGVSSVVLQQAFEKVTNHGCSGYVHDNSNNTQLKKTRESKRQSQ